MTQTHTSTLYTQLELMNSLSMICNNTIVVSYICTYMTQIIKIWNNCISFWRISYKYFPFKVNNKDYCCSEAFSLLSLYVCMYQRKIMLKIFMMENIIYV